MKSTRKGIVLLFCSTAVLLVTVGLGTPRADEPLLLVYPDLPTVFRYDPGRYEVVYPGHPAFDGKYDVSGGMLWDKIEDRIPHEVYRAPGLQGFEPSPFGMNEFVILRNDFNVFVDGFGHSPRTLHNLYIRFVPYPSHSPVQIELESEQLDGLVARIPDLVVTTPVGDGFYADAYQQHVAWSGAVGLRITVYSDKDNDKLYSGGEPLFSVWVEDNAVRTEETTWGAVKALYRR
jgi:hypothetical protein